MIHCGEIDADFLTKLLIDESSKLVLCSPGGEVYLAIAAVEAIQRTGNYQIFGTGQIMSAAVVILAAGAHRIASEGTRFMVHNVSLSDLDSSTPEESSCEADEHRLVNAIYLSFLERFSKKSAAWWAKQCATKPFYFGAETALKLGLIDDIVRSHAGSQK